MSGLKDMPPELIRQYSSVYGPFVSGDYAIGQQIKAPGVQGEIIWSYRAPLRGLAYVVDDGTGWPAEVQAHEVQQAAL